MRILLATALLAVSASAQSTAPPQAKEQLRFTLILSRHGIRSPLTPAATLNTYSTDPWPQWEVPLGDLTPHGAEAVRQMGGYLRADFARTGLLPSATCPAPADMYLYSDTDQRNIASTRASYAGFAPGCPAIPVNTWAVIPGQRDPLFIPIGGKAFPPPPPDQSLAAYHAALGKDPAIAFTAADAPPLNRLAAVLAPSRPAATPLLSMPTSLTATGSGDPIISARGPLPTAAVLISNFLLEYTDGKPLSEVAWGLLGATPAAAEATLNSLMAVSIRPFSLAHRTTFFARAESSDLLAHILDTLQQAAGAPATGTPATTAPPPSPRHFEDRINGAFGPVGTKVVFINAHDSNLFGVAGLLGLHWTADGRTDDTPPDSQLVFELWQATYKHHPNPDDDTPGRWFVRIRYRAQTLSQLRSAAALSPANPPAEVDLRPTGCRSKRCDLPIFLHAARATIDPAYTQLDVPPTQPAP